ncbi:MAG: DUF7557 family protein [bacterium]
MAITTIKLQKQTKERLDKLKEHKRESYDEILKKLLYILNTIRADPDRANFILDRIDDNRKRMIKQEQEAKKEKEK